MKEIRLKYTAFLLEKYDHKGMVVQKIQENYSVHRSTVYRDIKKVSHFRNNPDK